MSTPDITFETLIPPPDGSAGTNSDKSKATLVRQVFLQNGPDWRSLAFDDFANGTIKTKHLLNDPKFARMWTAYSDQRKNAERGSAELLECFREASRIALDRPRQLQLHARVLARQDIETIADLMDIRAPVVETYEDLYFDVRPNIEARVWISNRVFHKVKFARDLTERHLLTTAYYGGAYALEIALQDLSFYGAARDLTTAAGQRREMVELTVIGREFLCNPSTIPEHLLNDQRSSSPDGRAVSRSPGQLLHSRVMSSLGSQLEATDADQSSTTAERARVAV